MVLSLPAMTHASIAIPELTTKEISQDAPTETGLFVEHEGAFEIPLEIKEKMSKEELYQLQAIPGYFTPKQVSVQQINRHQLLQNNPQPVKAVVVVDEEMREELSKRLNLWPNLCSWDQVYNWAWNILEGGDDYLEIPFAIDIQLEIATNWETPDDWNYYDLLYAIDDVDPRGVGCDILLLITAQQHPGIDGLAWGLDGPYGGRHFVMDCTVSLPANCFQHEASHLFGAPDHGYDLFTFCIMSYIWTYWTRGYCSGCTAIINSNKFRYD